MASDLLLKSLGHAWRVLTERGVEVCLMGGLAMSRWGHARFTRDIDLLAIPGRESMDELASHIAMEGFASRHSPVVLRVGKHAFIQLLYTPKGRFDEFPVDILIADSDYLRAAVMRAVPLQLDDLNGRVVSCEDLILLKLQADRLIDRADVCSLLQLNRSTLDMSYLTAHVEALGLRTEWEAWWKDAFPNEPALGSE